MSSPDENLQITFEIQPKDSIDPTLKLIEDESVEESDGEVTLEEHVVEGQKITGANILAQAKARGNMAGIRSAAALLRNQAKIPAEYRGKRIFVFAGAVRGAYGDKSRKMVAFIRWSSEESKWILRWGELKDTFNALCRSMHHKMA